MEDVEPFDLAGGGRAWPSYVARLQRRFEEHNIFDDETKKSRLTGAFDSDLYILVHRALFELVLYKRASYQEVVQRVQEHLDWHDATAVPTRVQQVGESIDHYVADLLEQPLPLVTHPCTCGNYRVVVDQFVFGLHDAALQDLLSSKPDLTFDVAHQLALAAEATVSEGVPLPREAEMLTSSLSTLPLMTSPPLLTSSLSTLPLSILPVHISTLPSLALITIFRCLSQADRGKVAQVCTGWRDVVYCASVWRDFHTKLVLNGDITFPLAQRGINRVVTIFEPKCITSDRYADHLSHLPQLAYLSFAGTLKFLDGDGPLILRHLKKLVSLDLSNGGEKVTDASLVNISTLPALSYLDLRGCQVTDAGIARLCGGGTDTTVPSLEFLGLDGLNLTGESLACLATGQQNLTNLNLCECHDIGMASLAHLAQLHRLRNLTLCCLNDGGMKMLAAMPSLQDLVLHHPNLSDRGLEYLANGVAPVRLLVLHTNQGLLTDDGLGRLSMLASLRGLCLHFESNETITYRGLVNLSRGRAKITHLIVKGCILGFGALIHVANSLIHLEYLRLEHRYFSEEGLLQAARSLLQLVNIMDDNQCGYLAIVLNFRRIMTDVAAGRRPDSGENHC